MNYPFDQIENELLQQNWKIDSRQRLTTRADWFSYEYWMIKKLGITKVLNFLVDPVNQINDHSLWAISLTSKIPKSRKEADDELVFPLGKNFISKLRLELINSLTKAKIIILDLDGVLITTPAWKADQLDSDGYSSFNSDCVDRLNVLLAKTKASVILSSSRRKAIRKEEFNKIFSNRNLKTSINSYLPILQEKTNRGMETEDYLDQQEYSNYLIIDDDKSLLECSIEIQNRLVLCEFHKGFTNDNLERSLNILNG